MQSCTFIILAAVVALALAEGQFYVPRSYYIIDSEGHESPPVPLRRLRRSAGTYPIRLEAHAFGRPNANARPARRAEATLSDQSESSRPKPQGAWNLPGWYLNHNGV